jgi:3',5'-cyclic AMP phosphodiesterase CpdA
MQRSFNHLKTAALAVAIALLLCVAVLAPGCSSGQPASKTPVSSRPQTAASDSGASFKFIVCGDPQNDYEVFDKVLAAARSVDFLLIAGDLTGSGTPTELQNFVDHMKSSGVRYYCVPGNHDVATSPVGQAYSTYLGPPHQSFDYKNSHFLLIDNSTPGLGFYPEERQWAAADLKAAKAKGVEHSFAVAHVPPRFPYSAKASSDQIAGIDANEQLAPVLSAGGVEELFCGHVHTYEQEKEDGLPITITGGAGAPLFGSTSYHNYVLVEIDGRRRTQSVVRI